MTTLGTQAHIDMVYEGPSLADGSMNVRDLGPALLAMGSFFDEANRVANGALATIGVNVRATSLGSFEITFEVIQNIGNTPVFQVGVGDFISTAVDLKQLLGGGGGLTAAAGGIIWLIKALRGRTPRVQKITDDLYKFTLGDEAYEVPLLLLRLYQDVGIRRNIADLVKPLNEPGIDSVAFREKEHIIQEVTKGDVPSFALPDSKEKIVDEITPRALSIVSLVFKEDNKWRLSDGDNTFSVTISDEEFLEQIDAGTASFSKHDILICELRTIQWRSNAGLSTEYEVVRVVEHRKARQLPLSLYE